MNRAALLSFLTSIILSGIGGVATKIGIDAGTTQQIAGVAALVIVAVLIAIWKAALHSENKVIAAAAKAIAPEGGVIQTTPEKADAIPAPNVVAKVDMSKSGLE